MRPDTLQYSRSDWAWEGLHRAVQGVGGFAQGCSDWVWKGLHRAVQGVGGFAQGCANNWSVVNSPAGDL
jgi:hypothetical protein